MLGEMPDNIGLGVRSIIKKKGSEFIFNKVNNNLNSGDIVFGNLEVVLSNKNLKPKNINSICLRGEPYCVNCLKEAGFNVLSIANNHALEHGIEAFKDTLNILFENEISTVGLKDNESNPIPLIINKNGLKIGIIGCSTIIDHNSKLPLYYFYNNSLFTAIKKLKNEVDFTIVSIHWGYEHIEKPSPEQIILGRKMVDSGANLVLGHHSHCIQGCEEYNNALIVYSLGNFVFDLKNESSRKSWFFEFEISKNNILNYSYKPIIINELYQPVEANGSNLKKIDSIINLANYSINTNELFNKKNIKYYEEEAKTARKKYRNHVKLNFIKNINKLPYWVIKQNIINYLGKK